MSDKLTAKEEKILKTTERLARERIERGLAPIAMTDEVYAAVKLYPLSEVGVALHGLFAKGKLALAQVRLGGAVVWLGACDFWTPPEYVK